MSRFTFVLFICRIIMAYWQVQYHIRMFAKINKKKTNLKLERADFLRVLLIDLLTLEVDFPFDMIIETQVKQKKLFLKQQ